MFNLDLNPEDFKALRQGKIEPFNKIFDEVYRPLCDYIYNMSNGANDGEDIVQEALIKFHDVRTFFFSEKEIMGFLFKICRHAYFNWMKHNGVVQKHIRSLSDDLDTNEPEYVEAETMRIIYAEIEKLPAECKKVFKLMYINGYTNQEIMKMLDMSASLVSNHKKYAITKLKIGLANKRFIIMALMVTMFWLKIFLGSFSIFAGVVVHYYSNAVNLIL